MKRWIGALAAVALLSACGSATGERSGATSPSPTSFPTSSPASAPASPLIAVLDQNETVLRLVTLDGVEVASASPAYPVVGVGGSRAVYLQYSYHRNTGGGDSAGADITLKALNRDGSIEILGQFPGHFTDSLDIFGGFVLSPDGSQWLYTEGRGAIAPSLTTSRLHLVSYGGSDRVIASLESSGTGAGPIIVSAYRWDDGGALVAHRNAGEGDVGAPPGAHGDTYMLEPASASLSPLWSYTPGAPGACDLVARAIDGTIACLIGAHQTGYTLKIGKPSNLSVSIPFKTDDVNYYFAVAFKPGSTASVAAVGHCDVGTGAPLACSTDVVDFETGQFHRFGPDGVTPPGFSWAWLDDGSLLEVGQSADHYVTYVVSPGGTARLLTTGRAVGVLSG